MKKADLKTIKVLDTTVTNLNIISAITNERQYEAIDRIAKNEMAKVIKKKK